jgi:hypothetical protein
MSKTYTVSNRPAGLPARKIASTIGAPAQPRVTAKERGGPSQKERMEYAASAGWDAAYVPGSTTPRRPELLGDPSGRGAASSAKWDGIVRAADGGFVQLTIVKGKIVNRTRVRMEGDPDSVLAGTTVLATEAAAEAKAKINTSRKASKATRPTQTGSNANADSKAAAKLDREAERAMLTSIIRGAAKAAGMPNADTFKITPVMLAAAKDAQEFRSQVAAMAN